MKNNNRVISASAGTGKTHRLAIEYISILIKNFFVSDTVQDDFQFEKILVITFTRKAAAEIRNMIFTMLEKILINKDKSIINQLEESTGKPFNDDVFDALQKINIKIKTQKDKVRISTIDALINQVFKTMIAPIMKLSHYTIDEKANFEVWEKIFEELVKDENIAILQALSDMNPQKNIETLGDIFDKLIEERWVYYFISQSAPPLPPHKCGGQREVQAFQNIFLEYCKLLHELILQKLSENKKDRVFSDYLNNVVIDAFGIKKDEINEHNFLDLVKIFVEKGIFKLNKKRINNIRNNDYIKLYSGTYIRNAPFNNIPEIKEAFLKFIYLEYVLKEYKQILDLWEVILSKYDKIKQKSGVLSYSDIAWYTYKYLYDPEYSMIDTERMIVENQFYEFLTVRNQYLLIDEFQDTSLIQFMILAPMMNELSSGVSVYDDTAVIVVGDEKQSIYGWRGGVRELLKYMQTFLRVKEETLNTCYRSVPVIVNFVNELFGNEMKDFVPYLALPSTNNPQNPIEHFEKWQYPSGITSSKKDEIGAVYNVFFEPDSSAKDVAYFEFVENIVLPAWEGGSENERGKLGETAILARTNKELEKIASILTSHRIPFVKESSRSIFDHKIPKALINLLRYIQYRDYNALLKFLRSDILLIDSTVLKDIAMQIIAPPAKYERGGEGGENISTSILSYINEIYSKYHSSHDIDILYKNPLILCNYIIEIFDIASVFKNEIDLKNLYTFLGIISDFLSNSEEYTPDLDGFLRFCEVGSEKSNQKQLSTHESEAISLLTIHKAKGLGFDTVFLYYDAYTKKPPFSNLDIDFTVDFNNFNRLKNVFLGLNYKSVLKELFESEFMEIQNRNDMEELNNTYVALTRAKTNLAVFWVYKEKDLIETKSIKTKIVKNAKLISDKSIDILSSKDFIKINNLQDTENITQNTNIKDYFDIENRLLILKKSQQASIIKDDETDIKSDFPLKTIFLTQKSKLHGSAAHIYLSYIKYDLPYEHNIAYLQTKRLYGNILTKKELSEIVKKVNLFIASNTDLFSRDWDKIFNELTLFNKEKISRIDRLMINTRDKKILIVDFKTGKISDDEQIDRYKLLVEQLPIVKNDNYQIETRYVSV